MKTIITASLTGAVTPKAKCPALPITPREIAEDGIKCWKAGASILHLHMRDDNGFGTMDPAKFRETVHILKEEGCDALLCLTTSGELGVSDERRMEHIIELKPELATFDAASINLANGAIFMNKADFLMELGAAMIENGVKPEVEIMDLGFLAAADYYQAKGVLKAPIHYQFVLGFFSGAPATPENLALLKAKLPANATWSALGIGSAHMPILYAAISMGGHVRVGLEDNLYYSRGVLATNTMLVERAARVITEFGNEVATPDDAREILGLKK